MNEMDIPYFYKNIDEDRVLNKNSNLIELTNFNIHNRLNISER